MSGFIQFELWKDCNHDCPFCTARGIKKSRDKVAACKYAKDILTKDIKPYDSISLIGGEFFDGQLADSRVRQEFYSLVDLIAEGIAIGRFGRFLICTSFMYADVRPFWEFIVRLQQVDKSLTKYLMVCTSWDSEYRFTSATFSNWEYNIKLLKDTLPETRLHVESIMTGFLVDRFLEGSFSAKSFERHIGCTLDFNTPFKCHGAFRDKMEMQEELPNFFPKRKDFLTFLHQNLNQEEIDLSRLLNYKQHSTNFHYSLNDKDWVTLPQRHNRHHTCIMQAPCQNKCCGYIDSDVKMHQDVDDIRDMLQ